MGEIDLTAPLFNLGETRELRAVVHGNGLKDLRELVSKLFLEQLHGTQNGAGIFAGNLEGNVVLRFLLQQGESLPAFLPTTVLPSQWPSSMRRAAISGRWAMSLP